MQSTDHRNFIIAPDDPILITGATGFIGPRVVAGLLALGFRNLRCMARRSGRSGRLEELAQSYPDARITIVPGNLQSREDCVLAARDAALVLHLAAGRGEKSFPDAFLNSVVTTRNLLEACAGQGTLRRFVNVSSFTVYDPKLKSWGKPLDESCPIETHPELRGEAYGFAKVRQDEIVAEYGEKVHLPYVIVRPGYVFGPGNQGITGRVGLGTFGIFLHLGGSNRIPFTYVENCADAIVLAGLVPGIDGESFNVVDDNLPSSRQFLRLYKKNVRRFPSVYVPHAVSYALCYLWERYSSWSQEQLPPVFNRKKWYSYWKRTGYSNQKLKTRTGWMPRVPMREGLRMFFESLKNGGQRA